MGRITIPFKMKFERELDALKGFRDALANLEKQKAYDELIKACTAEQAALANADIPAMLDAMLLTASVDNRKQINHLQAEVASLKETLRMIKSRADQPIPENK